MDHILSLVLFWPLAALLILVLIPSSNTRGIKLWANLASFLGFAISLPLVFNFDSTKDYQFVEKANWIPSIGATYHLGIDGLGLLLVMLTTRANDVQWWVFWAFFVGFAVKVPMFPFHTWLPDAHTEAPTAGSVILASVLLKMGTYGFLRFSLPLLPASAKDPTIINAMAILSVIGIVYGALACLMQKDWKKLVAYSSVSHLGFCTLGIFALNPAGIAGSILQQINHGISTGMLFLIVGIVYERRHTREIAEYGGLLHAMPIFTIIFLIAALSSMGMPPLNGFIGEITILQGAYQMSLNWAVWGGLGIVLGAAYLMWLFQRTMLG